MTLKVSCFWMSVVSRGLCRGLSSRFFATMALGLNWAESSKKTGTAEPGGLVRQSLGT